MFKRLFFLFASCVASLALAAPPQVEMKTNLGEMTLELYPDKAPATVANFLDYVKSGHYNGTVFHRVIDGFMIQGGGFTPDLEQKPTGKPIRNEAANGLKNETFSLAMARTGDPHSATAQFFINVANNGFLDHRAANPAGYGYCVFGKVIKGQDVVSKIAKSRTGGMGPFPTDVPLKPVLIESMRVLTGK
jgi:peptidyl-prolyl cis-trans isomerase A (cyclophilin A)/peptidyl-prolyl cis-trans isomerase B (cyclophilin B)